MQAYEIKRKTQQFKVDLLPPMKINGDFLVNQRNKPSKKKTSKRAYFFDEVFRSSGVVRL